MIIDTPWNTTGHLDRLKRAGVAAIIRYYNHLNSKALPEKRLEPTEADAIRACGMKLAVIFQQRQNTIEDFNAAKGRSAAGRAMELAVLNGQPSGSAIYFAIDGDFIAARDLHVVRRYLAAAREEIAGRYGIGAYGSGKVLQNLLDHRLIDCCWLSHSSAWSGYAQFKASGRWNLLQGPVTKVAGVDCDTNIATGDFGAF